MYVLWSGKNLGFAGFLNENKRENRQTHWTTASSYEQGDGKVNLHILGMTEISPKMLISNNTDLHWHQPSASILASLFMCKVWVSEIEGEQDQNGWLWG